MGYKVIGKLSKDDYAAIMASVESMLQQESSFRLLLDLAAF